MVFDKALSLGFEETRFRGKECLTGFVQLSCLSLERSPYGICFPYGFCFCASRVDWDQAF